jgi:predicted nucleotidyltransferase
VTNRISRPATIEDLKTLLRSLNAHGVEYLLIGGYALAAHGYQRATTDIDILFPATLAAGQRVKDALMILPDQAARDLEPQWFEEGENIRVADAFIVDVMLNANGQTYDTLRHYGETLDLDGIPVRTVNLEGLLLTKQTMRDKDIADRIVIEQALDIFRRQVSGKDSENKSS